MSVGASSVLLVCCGASLVEPPGGAISARATEAATAWIERRGFAPISTLPSGEPTFRSAFPVAATVEEGSVLVFGVSTGGRVTMQRGRLAMPEIRWSPTLEEVWGSPATDRGVVAVTAGDDVVLFVREAASGSLQLARRTRACLGGACWSSFGHPDSLGSDFAVAAFAAAAAADGRIALVIAPPSDKDLQLTIWSSIGWSPLQAITLGTGEGCSLVSDRSLLAAFDEEAELLHVYGQLTCRDGDGTAAQPVNLTRLSTRLGEESRWSACPLPPRDRERVPGFASMGATIVDGAETLYQLDGARGQVMARLADGTSAACPEWSAPDPTHADPAALLETPTVVTTPRRGRLIGHVLIGRDPREAVVVQFLNVVRIRAIRVSDDDGSFRANLTGPDFSRWIAYANAIFGASDLRFQFVPGRDLSDRWDSTLNHTEMCPSAGSKSVPCLARGDAEALVAEHPDRLVVLVRAGNTVDAEGRRQRTGGGSGHPDPGIVVMPGYWDTSACGRVNRGLLAHELGHVLGLAHTFSSAAPNDPIARTQWAMTRLEYHHNDLRAAFDADALMGVADTAPDPSTDFDDDSVEEYCRPVGSATTMTTRWGTVSFLPPRRNIMSYYSPVDEEGSPVAHELSHDQAVKIYAGTWKWWQRTGFPP